MIRKKDLKNRIIDLENRLSMMSSIVGELKFKLENKPVFENGDVVGDLIVTGNYVYRGNGYFHEYMYHVFDMRKNTATTLRESVLVKYKEKPDNDEG